MLLTNELSTHVSNGYKIWGIPVEFWEFTWDVADVLHVKTENSILKPDRLEILSKAAIFGFVIGAAFQNEVLHFRPLPAPCTRSGDRTGSLQR